MQAVTTVKTRVCPAHRSSNRLPAARHTPCPCGLEPGTRYFSTALPVDPVVHCFVLSCEPARRRTPWRGPRLHRRETGHGGWTLWLWLESGLPPRQVGLPLGTWCVCVPRNTVFTDRPADRPAASSRPRSAAARPARPGTGPQLARPGPGSGQGSGTGSCAAGCAAGPGVRGVTRASSSKNGPGRPGAALRGAAAVR